MTPALRPILFALALMPGPAAAADLTVFAAASLKTALDEIEAGWEAETGRELAISYAGSSALARQIEAGAPADVFISASADWMDALEASDLIHAGSRRDILGNTLVVVAPAALARPLTLGPELPERLGDGWIAMALVDAVPAGIYGKAALAHYGLWDDLKDRIAQTDNVRAALALVSAGEAALGIVYLTDARADPNVAVVATFPQDSHPPIVYPAAATTESLAGAEAFLDWLSGPAASAAFERQGFTVLGP